MLACDRSIDTTLTRAGFEDLNEEYLRVLRTQFSGGMEGGGVSEVERERLYV